MEGWQQFSAITTNWRVTAIFGARRPPRSKWLTWKSPERDAQLESVLGLRGRELGLEIGANRGCSLSRELADSIPFDHGRDISRGISMSR